MKSFAAMMFGQRHLISLLLLFLILGGINKPAEAATFNYTGPAFSIAECAGQFTPSSICISGNITGSVTIPDSVVALGYANASQITSWSMSAGGVTLSSSGGNWLNPNATGISFSDGLPITWEFAAATSITATYAKGGDSIVTDWPGAGGVDQLLVGSTNGIGSYSAVGIVYTPPSGTWNLSTLVGAALGSQYPGCVTCGDPISLGTGNTYEEVMDYTTVGQNTLGFTRYYNSLARTDPYATELGSNWRSNYDRYLNITSATSVTVERADGRVLAFTNTSGVWSSDSDVDISLTNSGSTWALTDHNDTVETYTQLSSGEALLQKIVARDGYTQTLAYNSSNQLATVTDSYGRTLTFTYDSRGSLTQVATPDALLLAYDYGSSGVLVSVTYNTTPTTQQIYTYVNKSDLASITDEDGNVFASWTYDSQHRALTSQQGNGADLMTISYDSDTQRTVTNALRQQTVYTFTTLQGVPKITGITRTASATVPPGTETFTYDASGYTASKTDWNGNVTNYVNDIHGDLVSIAEAAGTAQARATTITYDSVFQHLPDRIVTPELTTSYTYDGNGNPLTKTLTDTTAQTVPYSTKGQTRTWTYSWSNFLLATIRNPLGSKETTSFTYDSTGTLTGVSNALNQKTRVTKHLPGGLPQTVVDPNGVTTNLAYTPRLWLSTSAVTTSSGVLTKAFTYDAAGNLTKVTLPDGSAFTNGYDTAHRLTSVTDLFNQSIAYTLDAMGDRTLTRVSNSAMTLEREHSGVFDALGRVLQDIGGVGQTTRYAYDSNGNATSVTNPLTHVTLVAFDALNHLTQVTQPSPVGGIITTTYDPHDRPLTVTDPNGGLTSYVYDGFGDVIQQTSPDSGKTVYYYNADGYVTKKTDATGAVTQYTYDTLDRVLTTKYPADTKENLTYTYDQSGHGFGIGRLTSVTDAAGTLSRSYDERGNMLSETRKGETGTLLTSYTYDAASRISSITYPSGWLVAYSRDVMGRITGISTKAATSSTPMTVLSAVLYQPFGPVSSLKFGNGIAETRAFDLDYRMTGLADSGSATPQNLTYGYDSDDNILAITDAVTPANSQKLGYDVLDRLTSATGGYGNLAYTYDQVGNRLVQTLGSLTTTYGYAAHTNRLSGIAAGTTKQSIGTTAAGNISSFTPALGSVTSLTYNKANRLAVTADKTKTLARYTYDAFGQRLVKTTTTLAVYGFDFSGHLLEERIAGAITDYVYLDGRPVATLTPSTGALAFLIADRLGTPQRASNASQSTVWAANYQPYGLTGTITTAVTQNLRLPGQHADAESGFYHNGFRDYVPALGRYIESDPIGLEGGLNLYGYVRGNPLRYYDPFGLDITINYYGPFPGHVGVSVNNAQSTGYYGSYSGNSSGNVGALIGENGLGVIKPDKGQPWSSVTIATSPEQDAQAVAALLATLNQPGEYNLYGNNCATKAEGILNAANVPFVPGSNVPYLLIEELQARQSILAFIMRTEESLVTYLMRQ